MDAPPPSVESRRLLVVIGPTASGKSSLALWLARRLDGEIVNCDSVQLYRGFDIGSAKTPAEERQSVPHHLLDILDPAERATAGDYARLARLALQDISGRGRLPILVGGTGLYLRAALHGLFRGPGRDDALRLRLERIVADKGSAYLHRLLTRLDPDSATRIHANDQPKAIRAIEVCLLSQRPFSEVLQDRTEEPLTGYEIVEIGLAPPREALYERIDRRTQEMFDGGLLQEVRSLLESGVSPDAWPFSAVGYRQAIDAVRGGADPTQAAEAAAQATRRYSKRQMTWFRRQEPDTVWLEGFGDDSPVQQAAWEIASKR